MTIGPDVNWHQSERDRLRELWDDGLASGPGGLKALRAIKVEARRRLLEGKPQHLR
jgi:hypothetical protein